MNQEIAPDLSHINFGSEGQEPKHTVFSYTEGGSLSLPPHLRPKTASLWEDIIRNKSYELIDDDSKELIFKYFFTLMTSRELVEDQGIKYQNIQGKIQRRMLTMWKGLPINRRLRYKEADVKKLKDPARFKEVPQLREKRMALARNAHEGNIQELRESLYFDHSKKERAKNPRKGAISNLSYANGPHFPSSVRNFYIINHDAYVMWRSEKDPSILITYRQGQFYFEKSAGGKTTSEVLTPELIEEKWNTLPYTVRSQTIGRFGRLSKDELRQALIDEVRFGSNEITIYRNGHVAYGTILLKVS